LENNHKRTSLVARQQAPRFESTAFKRRPKHKRLSGADRTQTRQHITSTTLLHTSLAPFKKTKKKKKRGNGRPCRSSTVDGTPQPNKYIHANGFDDSIFKKRPFTSLDRGAILSCLLTLSPSSFFPPHFKINKKKLIVNHLTKESVAPPTAE
jgi:hypothetical protein